MEDVSIILLGTEDQREGWRRILGAMPRELLHPK